MIFFSIKTTEPKRSSYFFSELSELLGGSGLSADAFAASIFLINNKKELSRMGKILV